MYWKTDAALSLLRPRHINASTHCVHSKFPFWSHATIINIQSQPNVRAGGLFQLGQPQLTELIELAEFIILMVEIHTGRH
jgi:hypothetical protein